MFEEALQSVAGASGLSLDPLLLQACATHYRLLVTWNRTHNLTRITGPEEAARKHYLDCIVPLLKLPEPSSFIDVGSGAGFPGLMAALVWRNARATLIEPAQKRASFLTLAASAMGLTVSVAAPDPQPPRASLVLSRATFSPGRRSELVRYAAKDHSQIAVWGHRHDATTWGQEVSTWQTWQSALLDYEIEGLEARALLLAER